MKSKEKNNKTKAPDGKFKDVSKMFQSMQSNSVINPSISKLKQKIPLLKEEKETEEKVKDDKTIIPKKLMSKAVKSKQKEKSTSKSPPKTSSLKNKKKHIINDSSEEYDLSYNNSNAMDLDISVIKTDKPKEKAKVKPEQITSTNKKRKSPKRSTAKKKSSNNDNEIIGPLSGKTIVITGLFSVSRDDISNLLKGLGAKVTGSVSSKTSILLHGEKLEDGRDYDQGNKYKAAKKNNVTLHSIDSFEDYMKKLLKDNQWSFSSELSNNTKPLTLGKSTSDKKNNSNSSYIVQNVSDNNTTFINIQKELWTSKYHPKELSDIVGNQKNLENLINWLDNWDDVVLNGNKKKTKGKTSFKNGRPQIDNINARACLITGDPGIGKTSSVRLISKLKGYKTFETNASEQRNKNAIKAKVGFLFDNTTLYTGDIQTKNLIIMDEIDGIGGNEDRGGIAALIDIIKKTKTPIICIANDRQSMKLKSLVNHCYDLKFSKPDKRQVSSRLMKICENENIKAEKNALEFLCESVGNDIRQCINFLEFWTKNHDTISFNEIKGTYYSFNKDTLNMMSNFDAAQQLLNSSTAQKKTFRDRLDLFFIDYSLIPALIHENYFSCFKMNDQWEELNNLAIASDLVSMGDLIDKRIMQRQDWTLLPEKGIMSSVAITSFIKGSIPFPKFPEMFGKMSTMKKIKRELKELKYCFPNSSTMTIKSEVAPLFLSMMTNYLLQNDNNVESCIELMERYKMSMELFKENILDLSGGAMKSNYDNIGSTVKSALTREFNKSHKMSVIGKRKKAAVVISEENEMEFDPDGNVIEKNIAFSQKDQDEEEEDNDLKVKGKAKTKVKSKVKPKTKVKSSDISEDEQSELKLKPKPKAKTREKRKLKDFSEDFIDDEEEKDKKTKEKPKPKAKTKAKSKPKRIIEDDQENEED